MSDDLEKRVLVLARWLYESRHPVIFTGAGIITESGLPDFRGPESLGKTTFDAHAHLRFNEGIGEVLPKAVKRLKRLMGLFE
jgi:NAD-dependent SIR2 family protein deacetylase